MIKKIFFLLNFALIITISSYSQTIIINGKESTGKLTWSDFTGKIDKGSSFNAYTSYKFNTKSAGVKFDGDIAIINGFEVILELDTKNSWVKKEKQTDELLIHEQGHFNLGLLTVKEILEKFKQAKFTKTTYNTALQNIINETSRKYTTMGIKYDDETDHSKKKEQQLKWDNFFLEQLHGK